MIRYIVSLLLIGVGVSMVWKTQRWMTWFGRVAWAEAKLGSTWTFYKLLGVLCIFIAFLIVSGGYTTILDFFFRPR